MNHAVNGILTDGRPDFLLCGAERMSYYKKISWATDKKLYTVYKGEEVEPGVMSYKVRIEHLRDITNRKDFTLELPTAGLTVSAVYHTVMVQEIGVIM